MQKALGLAAQALFVSQPNPRVGCCIVSSDGVLLGHGYTQKAGLAHAEVMALADAARQQHDVRGATAYVTLEPCSHHGKTGPCCDALAQAGIAKVVAATLDPNPLVAGNGFLKLQAAGVAIEVGVCAQEAHEINVGFMSRMQRQKPWVRLKMAASIDGCSALPNGKSQWITSAAARADGHAWRARACAILTGVGTVLADDPHLTAREVHTPRQPHVVIVDSHLQTPVTANLFNAARSVWIYTAQATDSQRALALTAAGAMVISMPNDQGQVHLPTMVHDLAQREVNELHVEAGATLNGALLRDGLVDECVIYLAPQLLGIGRGIAQLGPLEDLTQGHALHFVSTEMLGPDLRIVARTAKPT